MYIYIYRTIEIEIEVSVLVCRYCIATVGRRDGLFVFPRRRRNARWLTCQRFQGVTHLRIGDKYGGHNRDKTGMITIVNKLSIIQGDDEYLDTYENQPVDGIFLLGFLMAARGSFRDMFHREIWESWGHPKRGVHGTPMVDMTL